MNARPEIAVVVSTKNRERRLASLIESLRGQDLDPERFEVVIVDNASTDGTPALLDYERSAGGLSLRLVGNRVDRGTAASRNAGWRAADAPLIAFTDDDCELDSGWLRTLLEAANRHPGALLQGRTEPIPRERTALGPFSRTKKVTSLGPFYETCNIAYPRELLERLGGFDAEAFPGWGGEDTDLAWRALAEGADAVFVPEALAYHAVNQLGPAGTLRLALGWSDAMGVLPRHPGIRRHLHHRFFWKRSHELFLFAVLGALLARRVPPAALLAVPYLRQLRGRAAGNPELIAFLPMNDALEMVAAARGGIRHRTPII